jgi:excisionase family DNA binding protein
MDHSPEPRPGGNLLARMQVALTRLTREKQSAESTLDLFFLAFLLENARFGYFHYGPVTLKVDLVEEIVNQGVVLSASAEESVRAGYSADALRFLRLLSDEIELSGRKRIDEVHFLLAFMRVNEGVPGRVFAELGVSPAQVRAYVPEEERAERLFSPEDAADYLGVHVKTVRNWIRSGRLPASRLAGQRVLRIRSSDLYRLLEPVQAGEVE